MERFGALAAFGRQPTPQECARMMFVERAARAWAGRAASENWAAWNSQNPDAAKLLNWLTKVGEANG